MSEEWLDREFEEEKFDSRDFTAFTFEIAASLNASLRMRR